MLLADEPMNKFYTYELFIELYSIEYTHENFLHHYWTSMGFCILDDNGVMLLSEYLLRFSTWQSRIDNLEGLTEYLTLGLGLSH